MSFSAYAPRPPNTIIRGDNYGAYKVVDTAPAQQNRQTRHGHSNNAADELPRLSGEFNHENYPASAITECLDAYVNALSQLKSRTSINDLRARLDQLALTHDALVAELADFAQRADKLSNAILALTAAAKPLQEPGIGPAIATRCATRWLHAPMN